MKAMKLFLLLGLVSTGLAIHPFKIENTYVKEKANYSSYRLERIAQPNRYIIELSPYLDTGDDNQFTFDGLVKLEFTPLKDSNSLILHSKNLTFESIKFDGEDKQIKYKFDNQREFLILESINLKKGQKYIIVFKYNGLININLYGFYRSSYIQNGTEKWLALTKLQPTYARSVFPCFDEPIYKATFKLTINSPSPNYHCLSNTKISKISGLKYEFEETPKMSTYLLAFIVSEFKKIGESDNFGVWTRPEFTNMGQLAYDIGPKILEAMFNFTNIDYYNMNAKLDLVAVPDHFPDAMENWGLITYKEDILLIDPEESTSISEYTNAYILTHEVAHQWFGNLVTCHWWSDTWLNEGFATYLQYLITNKVAPEFKPDKEFLVNTQRLALLYDSSIDSPALTNEVHTPMEIQEHFNYISYYKGASILRMMEHWLGSGTFQKGIQKYLSKNAFGNVEPKDLYDSLQLAANEDNSIGNDKTVEYVMQTWVTKAGYPVLNVSIDHMTGKLTLTQKRFIRPNESSDTLYAIPITYTTESEANFNDTKPKFIMTCEKVEGNHHHGWVIFNIQQTGFYRVFYDDYLYNLLIKVLRSENRTLIHEYNRGQIVDDAFNFAKMGYISYEKLLEIIQFLQDETDYYPWAVAYEEIFSIRNDFANIDQRRKMNKHILTLMQKVIEHLGFDVQDNDNENTKIFRVKTMMMACGMGHKGCIEKSLSLFANKDKDGIHPDIQFIVYCTIKRYGSKSMVEKLQILEEYEDLLATVCQNLIIL